MAETVGINVVFTDLVGLTEMSSRWMGKTELAEKYGRRSLESAQQHGHANLERGAMELLDSLPGS
jgi:hypothetical protein